MKLKMVFSRPVLGTISVLLVLTANPRVQAQYAHLDLPALQKLADSNDAKAQCELGLCYQKGEGVPMDYTKAAVLMRQSADQGYAPAQGQLGYYYGLGLGVTGDPAEAWRWYQKAADQGNAAAEY